MAEIGILGGSGLYELLEDADEQVVDTPYGDPSDTVITGTFAGQEVAFLPRHGRGHPLPPHRINYRANLWALHALGVRRLISPCAVGSLQVDVTPGTFVVLDQLVDRTAGRPDTYFDGPLVTHVSFADPYCPEMRAAAVASLADLGIPHRNGGTNVVIQGPRFSTRAESRWFSSMGWHVVGMTQYPEIALARELECCSVGVALVTDFDVGVEHLPHVPPVSTAEILETFQANLANLRRLLEELVPRVAPQGSCPCGSALNGARVTP
ncbi:MAG: S-methyl-5'-thioadenosine phosphorylase [Actinomycetota bacterium]|nr:S-methyl-5'-thioadenosine phosphorylase [Actinomycetota bacterium]